MRSLLHFLSLLSALFWWSDDQKIHGPCFRVNLWRLKFWPTTWWYALIALSDKWRRWLSILLTDRAALPHALPDELLEKMITKFMVRVSEFSYDDWSSDPTCLCLSKLTCTHHFPCSASCLTSCFTWLFAGDEDYKIHGPCFRVLLWRLKFWSNLIYVRSLPLPLLVDIAVFSILLQLVLMISLSRVSYSPDEKPFMSNCIWSQVNLCLPLFFYFPHVSFGIWRLQNSWSVFPSSPMTIEVLIPSVSWLRFPCSITDDMSCFLLEFMSLSFPFVALCCRDSKNQELSKCEQVPDA